MKKYHTNQTNNDQQGFASLVIGLVLIVVLALLTIGFAQLTRHEQQQALNKQLATQAYYAAETGINDVVDSIKQGYLTDSTTFVNTDECLSAVPNASGSYDSTIGPPENNVSYSCPIVSLKTVDLVKDLPINSGVTAVTSANPGLNSLTIKWTSATGKTGTGPGNFTYSGSWNSPAVIQFSITPLSAVDRQSLINNTFVTYLYPSTSASSATYTTSYSGSAPIARGACSSGTCNATINGIPTTGPYLIHMYGLYDSSSVTITGSGPGGSVVFSGDQAKIDVTGKAKNVLKRLQVRVPLDSSRSLANYAVEAQNICKRIVASPVRGSTTFDSPSVANDAACNIED